MGEGIEAEKKLYLIHEVEVGDGWFERQFKRVLFLQFEGEWSHRFSNEDWRPRGRTLPWREKSLEKAKQRVLDSIEGCAYYEEPENHPWETTKRVP